jgi:pilus assembly protein CpaE
MRTAGLVKMISPNTHSHTSLRVMVAGSDPCIRQYLVDVLARLNVPCPAGHAVSMEQAVDRASRITPDIVILQSSDDADNDRRVLGAIDKFIEGRVLVVGPANDPRSILTLLHSGADAYIDRENIEPELTAALVRFKLKSSGKSISATHGRIVGLIGAAGGSGTSTIAINLATCLARAHTEAALVDLRLDSADLSALLNLRPPYSLAEFCERIDRVDLEMFEQFLAPCPSGVSLIAAPLDCERVDRITAQGVCRAVAMARTRFPYVVVDLDNHLDEIQTEVLWHLDQLLIVLRLDYISIRNTRRLLSRLESRGIESDRVKLLANRFGQSREIPVFEVEKALDRKLDQFVRDDPRRVNKAVNRARPVVLEYPRSRVTRELEHLAAAVNGNAN